MSGKQQPQPVEVPQTKDEGSGDSPFGPWMLPKNKYRRQQKQSAGKQTRAAATAWPGNKGVDTQARVGDPGPAAHQEQDEVEQVGPVKKTNISAQGKGRANNEGKGVGPHRSRFSVLDDVDQEVDWAEKMIALKQKIQNIPGPGRAGPPVPAHVKPKSKPNKHGQHGPSTNQQGRSQIQPSPYHSAPNTRKTQLQQKPNYKSHSSMTQVRKPLLELSNSLPAKNSSVLEQGESSSKILSTAVVGNHLGSKEMEVEPPVSA